MITKKIEFFQTATLLSGYLWSRLTPVSVIVSVAYEPWNTDIRELEQYQTLLHHWGMITKFVPIGKKN